MKYDNKAGCTVMVSMELLSSQLLFPFIMFKGVFCAILMQAWQSCEETEVLFTKKHWMTATSDILYHNYLIAYFPQKKKV